MEARARPEDLIACGRDTLATMRAALADGRSIVHCQLLACHFYEAMARDPQALPMLGALLDRCRRAAAASPAELLRELSAAVTALEQGQGRPVRPVLRVIEGGRSRAIIPPPIRAA
jgi:hypothetical protein